ncbi:amidohydrolase family protein [Penicillium chermesinum]|uniref:Amidohydrolase family protein n=1 Tax=Penicillium chermesinum TaxID=63820 RepID=A0A9W9TE55_9EURO|nr:amidohydrolase family protein [Penicillium chermesinum]KAJ5219512.1 amidohydrolase family protein [Penicillium chermesinum]
MFDRTNGTPATRFQHQQDVLLCMVGSLRRDLTNDIATSVGRRMGFADSTARGTSTIIDIGTDLIPSMARLSLDELRKTLDRQGGLAVVLEKLI